MKSLYVIQAIVILIALIACTVPVSAGEIPIGVEQSHMSLYGPIDEWQCFLENRHALSADSNYWYHYVTGCGIDYDRSSLKTLIVSGGRTDSSENAHLFHLRHNKLELLLQPCKVEVNNEEFNCVQGWKSEAVEEPVLVWDYDFFAGLMGNSATEKQEFGMEENVWVGDHNAGGYIIGEQSDSTEDDLEDNWVQTPPYLAFMQYEKCKIYLQARRIGVGAPSDNDILTLHIKSNGNEYSYSWKESDISANEWTELVADVDEYLARNIYGTPQNTSPLQFALQYHGGHHVAIWKFKYEQDRYVQLHPTGQESGEYRMAFLGEFLRQQRYIDRGHVGAKGWFNIEPWKYCWNGTEDLYAAINQCRILLTNDE